MDFASTFFEQCLQISVAAHSFALLCVAAGRFPLSQWSTPSPREETWNRWRQRRPDPDDTDLIEPPK